ncbi:MAG: glycerol-3-phosphate dehydrogenase, partial [Deltaproteobacteria bacterium]|nr:glycerol-3-phosphate dehydrogenase [Deltaproteobacteria bacterium]
GTYRADRAAEAQAARQNRRYLPGRAFPAHLDRHRGHGLRLGRRRLVVTVVPSRAMR